MSDVVPAEFTRRSTETAAALAGEPRHYLTAQFPGRSAPGSGVICPSWMSDSKQPDTLRSPLTLPNEGRGWEKQQELFECFRAVTLGSFRGYCRPQRALCTGKRQLCRAPRLCAEEHAQHYEQFASKESLPRIRQILDTRYQGVYEIVARSRNGKSSGRDLRCLKVDVGGRYRVSAARDISAGVARQMPRRLTRRRSVSARICTIAWART